jgi:hypothetical protein
MQFFGDKSSPEKVGIQSSLTPPPLGLVCEEDTKNRLTGKSESSSKPVFT